MNAFVGRKEDASGGITNRANCLGNKGSGSRIFGVEETKAAMTSRKLGELYNVCRNVLVASGV
jgi:hypothetical protein